MTKEEAIEVFKNDIEICTIQQKQACDMAIKTLEQQPCEDCISRKEAINVVHYYFQHYLDVNDDICLDGIRTLPSVHPNRQKMCWKDRKSFLERWECPCCGHTETSKENFCKICGADMRGDTDE